MVPAASRPPCSTGRPSPQTVTGSPIRASGWAARSTASMSMDTRPTEGGRAPVHQHRRAGGRMAGIAVAIAHGGDADGMSRVPSSCRHSPRLAPTHGLDGDQPGAERHHRAQALVGPGAARHGRDAVEHDAGTHPLAVRLGPGENAGGVAQGALARAPPPPWRSGRSGPGSRDRRGRRRWRNASSGAGRQRRRRRRAAVPPSREPLPGRKPSRFMPVSSLSQTVSGRSSLALSSIRTWLVVMGRHLEAQPGAERQLVRREHALEEEDRLLGTRLAQRHRLLDAGHAKQSADRSAGRSRAAPWP